MSSMVTNLFIAAHGKQGSKMTEPKDFILDWSGENKKKPQEQSVDQMKNFLKALQTSQNRKFSKGEVNKRKRFRQ